MDTGVARLAPVPHPLTVTGVEIKATEVAGQIDRWGSSHPDLPDGPGPAFLLVALRPAPTMRHYDPEAIDYWVTKDGHGERRRLTTTTDAPIRGLFLGPDPARRSNGHLE